MKRRQMGVTLMELMIVVAVVGILAAIAIPTYRQYVIRANRADAKTALLNTAQNLERCFTNSTPYAYNGATCNAAVTLPILTEGGNYQISYPFVPTTTTYTLQAIPQGAQVADTRCGTFTLTSTGVQTVSGTDTAQQCWRR